MIGHSDKPHEQPGMRRAVNMRIRAEMARRQLLTHQLALHPHPDRDSVVYPKRDPETLAEVWQFLAWLDDWTRADSQEAVCAL